MGRADMTQVARYVGALDQGTTSTRFMVFDAAGREIARRQLEHRQILSRPGWVEHDPIEIVARVNEVIAGALRAADLTGGDLAAIGVTNQRETTVVWNPRDGRPWHNAIVWQDTRTDKAATALERKRALLCERRGSSGDVLLVDEAPVDPRQRERRACRGRTRRGDLRHDRHLDHLEPDRRCRPRPARDRRDQREPDAAHESAHARLGRGAAGALSHTAADAAPICVSSDPSAFGATRATGPVGAEVPIGGDLGDQHAAMVGQACFAPGEAKNTYGTGNFMLLNTGSRIVPSSSGLLTTIAYTVEDAEPSYALEGSVAVTGSAVQWLRDQLEVIKTADEIEALAASVPDSAGLYFVPAFSGLFAPYWRADARGVIAGLSRFHTRAHLARATLEAICFQTRAVLDAMVQDSGVQLEVLKVDGGATVNNLLMQLQADILGVPVVRPVVTETTALGAAYAAGLAVGFWPDLESLRHHWKADRQWEPRWSQDQREDAFRGWRKAVDRSLGWVEHPPRGSG